MDGDGGRTIDVLMTCDALRRPVRGVGRVCETLMRGLRGTATAVIPLDYEPNSYAEELTGRTCAVLPTARGPARTARFHATLLRRVAAAGIPHHVLVSTAGFPHVVGGHPRLCVFVHDLHMLESGFYQPGKRLWFRAFLGRSLARAALRICVSDHTKNELEKRYPQLDPRDNVVVHNAAPDTFAFDTEELASRGDRHFLFVGQLERRKNVSRLLDAFAAAGIDNELHLVGRPGPGGNEILAKAARNPRVHVHTNASDAVLRDLYHDSRAVLLPSLAEGFGIPVVEAMRAGAPVLTSKGTALAEVAEGSALLVDPRDTDAIRAGIVELENDAELRARLTASGVRRAQHFTERAQARALSEVLVERFG